MYSDLQKPFLLLLVCMSLYKLAHHITCYLSKDQLCNHTWRFPNFTSYPNDSDHFISIIHLAILYLERNKNNGNRRNSRWVHQEFSTNLNMISHSVGEMLIIRRCELHISHGLRDMVTFTIFLTKQNLHSLK